MTTISEVCNKYGVSQDTLRYYERIELIPKIKRNSGGFREYSENDCVWIATVKRMRTAGMPIEKLVQYMSLLHQGNETINLRKELLIEQRDLLSARIAELQDCLEYLIWEIEA